MKERFTLTVALAAAFLCFGACRAALEGDANPPGHARIPDSAETDTGKTPPAVLSSFSWAPRAEDRWVGVRVLDKDSIPSDMAVCFLRGDGETVKLAALSALPGWERIRNGEEMRLSPGIEAADFGALFLEDANGVVDFAAFTTDRQPSKPWFDGGKSLALADAVNAGLWPGTGIECAFSAGDPAAGDYAALRPGVIDGNGGGDWQRRALSIQGAVFSPDRASAVAPTDILLSVSTEEENVAAEARADFSALGGDTDAALERSGAGYSIAYALPAGLGPGDYAIPITLSGAGIVRVTNATFTVEPPAPTVTVENAWFDYRAALSGQTVTLFARATGQYGGAVSGVYADASSLGLERDIALTREAGNAGTEGELWACRLSIPRELTPGRYAVTVTAIDDAHGITGEPFAPEGLEAGTSVLAFEGGDCEERAEGASAGFAARAESPWEGEASVGYQAVAGSDKTLNFSGSPLRLLPERPRYLTFRFRGTVTGDAPGLRVQVGPGGSSEKNYFDLNGTEGAIREPECVSAVPFSTSPVSAEDWTLVRLDLSAVDWDNPKTPELTETGPESYPLQFRIRKTGAHDWYIDDVRFACE